MERSRFWEIIQKSKDYSKNDKEIQLVELERILSLFKSDEIISFYRVFQDLMNESYHFDLWAAAYIINEGCTEDEFDYFRGWLISLGEDIYTNALKDPESLVDVMPESVNEKTFFENIIYAAGRVYFRRLDEEIPLRTDFKWELKGDEWEIESVHKKFPKLSAKRKSG